MRRYLLTVTLLVVAGIAAGVGMRIEDGHAGPSRAVRSGEPGVSEFDFGATFPGQRLVHTFVLGGLHNRIRCRFVSVTTSCGCTSAEITPHALVPGKAVKLIVHVETKYWPGPELVLVRAVGVAGKRRLNYIFRVLYDTRRVISIAGNPVYLNLGNLQAGQPRRQVFFDAARGRNPMKWDSLTCTSTDRSLAINLVPLAQRRWRLGLCLKRANILGSTAFPLEFRFWWHGRPCPYLLGQLVTADVRGPITACPNALLIGAVKAGSTAGFRIRIVSPTGGVPAHTTLVGVHVTDPKRMSATIGSIAGVPCVNLRYIAALPVGRNKGAITIAAEVSGKRFLLHVDYLAMIRNGG